MRLLAAEGNLDGARAARERALERLQALRDWEPQAWQRSFAMGRLYLRPEAIAEPARAIPYLEDALRLDPGEATVKEALDQAWRAFDGK